MFMCGGCGMVIGYAFTPFPLPVQVEGQQNNGAETTPEIIAPIGLDTLPEVTPEVTEAAVG